MVKTLPSALQTHLDTGTTTLAWCWRLTRTGGAVFGFTDHDLALSFDGTTFQPERKSFGGTLRHLPCHPAS